MDLIKVECDLVRAFSWELPPKLFLAFAQYDNAIFLDGDWFDHQAGLSVTFFFWLLCCMAVQLVSFLSGGILLGHPIGI